MAEKTYNGWTNYETWAIALWLDNDQGSYKHWRREAQECWDEAEATSSSTRDWIATCRLAERIKDEIEEGSPLNDSPSLYSDLLGAALSEVDWREIAAHYIADVDRTEETPEEEDEEDDPGSCPQCGDEMDTDCVHGRPRCPTCDGPCPGCSDQ